MSAGRCAVCGEPSKWEYDGQELCDEHLTAAQAREDEEWIAGLPTWLADRHSRGASMQMDVTGDEVRVDDQPIGTVISRKVSDRTYRYSGNDGGTSERVHETHSVRVQDINGNHWVGRATKARLSVARLKPASR